MTVINDPIKKAKKLRHVIITEISSSDLSLSNVISSITVRYKSKADDTIITKLKKSDASKSPFLDSNNDIIDEIRTTSGNVILRSLALGILR